MSESNIFEQVGAGIINTIINSPFIVELQQGILDQEKFKFFLLQDMLYLTEYKPINQKLVDMITDNDDARNYFLKEIDGLEKEIEFEKKKYADDIPSLEQSPSNLLYTSYMYKIVNEKNLAKSLCALFACPWVYYKVGKYLKDTTDSSNPFIDWINEYSQDDYDKSISFYESYTQSILQTLSKEDQDDALKCFVKTCQMEYLFWDSAYKFESWPKTTLSTIKNENISEKKVLVLDTMNMSNSDYQKNNNDLAKACIPFEFISTSISDLTYESVKVKSLVTRSSLKSNLDSIDNKTIGIAVIKNVSDKESSQIILDSMKKLKKSSNTSIILAPLDDQLQNFIDLMIISDLVVIGPKELIRLLNIVSPKVIINQKEDKFYSKALSIICDNFKVAFLLVLDVLNQNYSESKYLYQACKSSSLKSFPIKPIKSIHEIITFIVTKSWKSNKQIREILDNC